MLGSLQEFGMLRSLQEFGMLGNLKESGMLGSLQEFGMLGNLQDLACSGACRNLACSGACRIWHAREPAGFGMLGNLQEFGMLGNLQVWSLCLQAKGRHVSLAAHKSGFLSAHGKLLDLDLPGSGRDLSGVGWLGRRRAVPGVQSHTFPALLAASLTLTVDREQAPCDEW
jgi:hypothetical protein